MRTDSGSGGGGRRRWGRPRPGSARFDLVRPDEGPEFPPQALLSETVRSQAWAIRELGRVALDAAQETVECPHCGGELELPGSDPKWRIEAAKVLLEHGLKLLKQSGDEEAVEALQAALGKAVADAGQRPKSVRDIQRETAAKLGGAPQ